ncbi:hypothetical protein HK100_005429 [Physocladia obscura]|uniref:Uncharacterized protein n=1 Tax=Physocladia obscura TaxID=109957 RepID=A0AAD5T7L3_9FUNG|nr:hypothetical protein HK100_005429 [Physocladia obscura]
MRQKNWLKTVEFSHSVFLFTAVSRDWIIVHALYRAVLVTLPLFDTLRHLPLEIASLTAMAAFWLYTCHFHNSKRPIEHFFGIADTVVVATACLVSAIFDIVARKFVGDSPLISSSFQIHNRDYADLLLFCISVACGLYAWSTILTKKQKI